MMTKNRWLTYSRRRKALVAKMRDNQIGQRLGIEVMASVPIVYPRQLEDSLAPSGAWGNRKPYTIARAYDLGIFGRSGL